MNPVFWLKLAGAAGVVLLALGASVGVGQSPAPRPSDDVLQLRVQSALDNDAELKPYRLTLLVNVVDRQAVIGGPVPNAALAPRLEQVAKGVPGITAARVKVWVPASLVPDDPLSRKVAELMTPPPAPKPVPPPPVTPAPLPPVTPKTPAPVPVLAVPPAVARPKPVPPVVTAPDPRPVGTAVSNKGPVGTLLDPVAPTGTGFRPPPLAPGAAPLPYATIPPPNVPPVPPQAEPEYSPVDPPPAPVARDTSGLDALRADARFAGLKVEIRDGVAVVSGRAAGGSERSWALAQAVRKLPGVGRVIVRSE
jgi:hypothetical protein